MTKSEAIKVGAIVLAAGMSKRMGTPKMALPYKGRSVIGTVLTRLTNASIAPLIVVTGGEWKLVEEKIREIPFEGTVVRNPVPDHTEMMDSLRLGMRTLPLNLDAFLIVLGDQPQILDSTVALLTDEYARTRKPIIIPSYQMRRGHPWLIGTEHWAELLDMPQEENLRDFLRKHGEDIHYLAVETPTILEDLDTPEDYSRAINP